MNKQLLCSVVAGFSLALAATVQAASADTYQVTGPVIEITDTRIVVEKEKGKNERWELKRDAGTKGAADVKAGDKVTITYTMTATSVEAKGDKAAKTEEKKK